MKSLDFSVSEDSESATPDIKVEITLPDILQLYTIGFSIIFISVTISSISVMRLKPREIFSPYELRRNKCQFLSVIMYHTLMIKIQTC